MDHVSQFYNCVNFHLIVYVVHIYMFQILSTRIILFFLIGKTIGRLGDDSMLQAILDVLPETDLDTILTK